MSRLQSSCLFFVTAPRSSHSYYDLLWFKTLPVFTVSVSLCHIGQGEKYKAFRISLVSAWVSHTLNLLTPSVGYTGTATDERNNSRLWSMWLILNVYASCMLPGHLHIMSHITKSACATTWNSRYYICYMQAKYAHVAIKDCFDCDIAVCL